MSLTLRQHKLEEALLFSGQFAEALQALVDWLYRVEPQLAEDQPVHGDLDLVSNLMDSHKVPETCRRKSVFCEILAGNVSWSSEIAESLLQCC